MDFIEIFNHYEASFEISCDSLLEIFGTQTKSTAKM